MGKRARDMLVHENVSSAAMATQIQALAASLRA
jgi:hypothetical protein